MLQYIFKRLLLMVPTFVLITIVVFLIINLAPGRPGQGGAGQGSENADQSANAREGYRLFKEQYNLDKPIVLNFRFLLDWEDVAEHLEVIARNMTAAGPGEVEALHVGTTAAGVLTGLLNTEFVALQQQLAETSDEARRAELRREIENVGFTQVDPIRPPRPAQGDVFEAEELVENWGNDIVPHLISLVNEYVWLVPDDSVSPMEDGRSTLLAELGEVPSPLFGTSFAWEGRSWRAHPVMTRKVRFLAAQRLSVNARRTEVIRPGERATEEVTARNREIVAENGRLARWVYPLEASDDEIDGTVEQWNAWYAENASRWERSASQQVGRVFLDTRFAKYIGNLLRFDLGTSIRYRRPVMDVIGEHWRYSVFISVASLILSYFISIPLGVLAAVRQNGFADRGIGILLFVLYSLPSFFAATLLQTYLTPASQGQIEWIPAWLQVFPVSGFQGQDPLTLTSWEVIKDICWHVVLPIFCLTYGSLAVLSRYARTGLLDVVRSDYIRTARAKGLSEWVVILKHAVRNGMIPILTLLGLTLPVLIGGSIIIEYIFVIDGMGKLMITAINFRDYNVIMGILLISSLLTLVGILISDISYALVDPRISFD